MDFHPLDFGDPTADFVEDPAPLDMESLIVADPLPVQSDATAAKATPLQLLGSIGTTARDLGTAVGKIQRDMRTASENYRQARDAAASGNSLSLWWQYASTTDKLMVGLAVVGIIVALKD